MGQDTIIIPNPCDENWGKMTPRISGRHCESCNKIVIDFSNMEVGAIKKYLDNKKNQTVCGHFNITQVKVPKPRHYRFLVNLYLKIESNFKIPVFKTITLSLIVLCMIVVGCNRPKAKAITGKVNRSLPPPPPPPPPKQQALP